MEIVIAMCNVIKGTRHQVGAEQKRDQAENQSYKTIVNKLIQFTDDTTDAQKANTFEDTYEIDENLKRRFCVSICERNSSAISI